ncbi:hypothetical protein MRB53_034590 [Persea americana]|uniref:Uncharacterized protein n=1 Tax=Persea americana TaxID=3435 RepID=A0ACC2K274_PERAE|nr:hypothetical protein MRB53_034590 [Persea americana]
MASSASPSTTLASSSPNLVISNIANLIPIKLDSTNFLLWKSLFRPILRNHHLEHFIDGSTPVPPREITTVDGKMTPNHAFFAWFEWDQMLLSWINATLSDSALPYIVGKDTANDAWESLEHISPVSKDDLIFYTLSGLPSVYRPFQTSIHTRSRHDPVLVEELHTLLVCEELSLAEDVTGDTATAFAASNSTPVPPCQSTTVPSQYQCRKNNPGSRQDQSSNNHPNKSFESSGQQQPPQGTSSGASQPCRLYFSRHVIFDEQAFPLPPLSLTLHLWLPTHTLSPQIENLSQITPTLGAASGIDPGANTVTLPTSGVNPESSPDILSL